MKAIYDGIKIVNRRPQKKEAKNPIAFDQVSLLNDKHEILSRFTQQFNQFMTIPESMDYAVLNNIIAYLHLQP